jgi:hypothetical protein
VSSGPRARSGAARTDHCRNRSVPFASAIAAYAFSSFPSPFISLKLWHANFSLPLTSSEALAEAASDGAALERFADYRMFPAHGPKVGNAVVPQLPQSLGAGATRSTTMFRGFAIALFGLTILSQLDQALFLWSKY